MATQFKLKYLLEEKNQVLGLINWTYKFHDNSIKNEKQTADIFFYFVEEKKTYSQIYMVQSLNKNIFWILD